MAPRRIFVPHVHEDDEHVENLRQYLNRGGREADVSAIDSSSPNQANDPDYIMSRYIRPKVEWCEAIVVLISPATQGSDWVDKEIDLAKQLDRLIIGVWIPGSEGCPIPQGLQDYANAIVAWNENSILDAIDGKINNINDAAGNSIAPQDIKRHNCQLALYSYVIVRDYGFAPNPFHGYCTLATCKPVIRRVAKVGDWVIGTGSTRYKRSGRLICAMRVSERMTFDEYWADPRFALKRPDLTGSYMRAFGDNIYHRAANGDWVQEDSHHSLPGGEVNVLNLVDDTQTDQVLVSNEYWYFGRDAPEIPHEFKGEGSNNICAHRGHKTNFSPEFVDGFVAWVKQQQRGCVGRPGRWP